MRRFGGKSRSAIGLDLGSRHVKAVQLERAGGGAAPSRWRVAAAARLRRARPGEPLALLYDDWDRAPYPTPFGPVPHDLAVRLHLAERAALRGRQLRGEQ